MEKIKIYRAKNEPVLSYRKGSEERLNVEFTYNNMFNSIKHEKLTSRDIRDLLGKAYSKYYTNIKWLFKHNFRLLS